MAGTTSKGLRYPTAGDTPAVHTDIKNLADDVDAELDDYVLETTVDAAGDLLVGTANNTVGRLAIGTAGQFLKVNSGATGLEYGAAIPSQTGNSGKYLTTDGTNASWGTVNQPTKWTFRSADGADSNGLHSFAYNGSNLYVAVGGNGNVWSSTDGNTWTERTSGTAVDFNKVAYGGGIFVAVGQTGTIITSTDGTTWTARTSNMSTNNLLDVHYANSTWVVVGQGGGATNTGGLAYSTDGITWTRKSQTPTIGTSYWAVTYNGTNWLIGADVSVENAIYASTPSGTWTAVTIGSGANGIFWLDYDGTRTLLAEATSREFYTSTSTTFASWTKITYPLSGSSSSTAKRFITRSGTTIYVANTGYWQSFSSASSTGGIANQITTLQFLPAIGLSTAANLSSNNTCIAAFSTGLFVGGSYQMIFNTL